MGVDNSPAARWALIWAIGEARFRRLPLLVVHATSASEMAIRVMGISPLIDVVPPPEDGASVISRQLADVTVPADLEVTTMSSYEDPGRTLTAIAGVADLLVVGRSECGFLSRLMARSVREYCAQNARTTLVIVPPPSSTSVDDAPVRPVWSRRWAKRQSAQVRTR